MEFRFEVAGDKLISRKLLRIADRTINFTAVFPAVADTIRAGEGDLFDTEGSTSGRPWKQLKPITLARKIQQGLDPRILHATGKLEHSLTGGHGGSAVANQLVIITPSSLAFGSTLPYAKAHQLGTHRLPQRRPLDFSEAQKVSIIKQLQRYALTGDIR